jgi:hypothetical protein
LQGRWKITEGWSFTLVEEIDRREKEIGKRERERVGVLGFIVGFLS